MVSTFPVYIVAVVTSLFFILLAAIISNMIKYQGGAYPKDPGKRRMWFWIMAVLAPVMNLFLGLIVFYAPLNGGLAKSKMMTAIGIGSSITFVIYLIVGFILSKIFKNGKLGNWF